MARVKKGVTAHARHKKILKLAKGYRGTRSRLFKKANETVMKALYYARRIYIILIVMNIAFFSVYPTTEDVQTHEETIMLEE